MRPSWMPDVSRLRGLGSDWLAPAARDRTSGAEGQRTTYKCAPHRDHERRPHGWSMRTRTLGDRTPVRTQPEMNGSVPGLGRRPSAVTRAATYPVLNPRSHSPDNTFHILEAASRLGPRLSVIPKIGTRCAAVFCGGVYA